MLTLTLALMLTLAALAIEQEEKKLPALDNEREPSNSPAHHIRAVRPLEAVVDEGQRVLGGVEELNHRPVLQRVGGLLAVEGELRRDEVRQDVVREDVAAPVTIALFRSPQQQKKQNRREQSINGTQPREGGQGGCAGGKRVRGGEGAVCDRRSCAHQQRDESNTESNNKNRKQPHPVCRLFPVGRCYRGHLGHPCPVPRQQ